MTSRNWSTYQQGIFDATVQQAQRNLTVSAVAGSGKTTTLVEVSNRLPKHLKALFVAFNKHIVGELSSRMKDVDCMTIHSLGMKSLRSGTSAKVVVKQYKYSDMVKDQLDDAQDVPLPVYAQFAKATTEIVDKARLTLTDLSDSDQVDWMIDHFGILDDLATAAQKADVSIDYLETRAIKIAAKVIRKGVRLFQERGEIDFTDMIYLPAKLGLSLPQYDVVLVDEAQDLSAAQLSVVMGAAGYDAKSGRCRGRIIAVGDRAQAIMGFSGASNDSFDNIIAKTDALELPLSVCYRCPSSHLDLAREFVPHIEAAPGAPEGVIEWITMPLAIQLVRRGDLFVCRMNAPLVGAALKMIAGGVQARVRGKNIATGLVKMIDDATKITVAREGTWRETFVKQLQRLVDVRIETLRAKEHTEVQQETVNDQQDCIVTFLEGSPTINDAETLKDELQGLFADESAAVWLSSIHKAKGLESDRVFILRPDRIELKHKNMRAWQIEQERNLHYVALTRAKATLYFVEDQPAAGGSEKEPAKAEKAPETVADHRMADRVASRFSQLDIFNR